MTCHIYARSQRTWKESQRLATSKARVIKRVFDSLAATKKCKL